MKTHHIRVPGLVLAVLLVAACGFGPVDEPGGDDPIVIELEGVELSAGTLTPAFDPAVTSYTAAVDRTVTGISVTVTSNDENVAATVNGANAIPGTGRVSVTLAPGANTITVRAIRGVDSRDYTIEVTRESAPELRVTGLPSFDATDPVELADGATVDFGETSLLDLTFTIENIGSTTLSLTGTSPAFVTLVQTPDDGSFSIPTQPDTPTIPPQESVDFVVRLDYLGFNDGDKSGTITIENDDADEPDFTLALTGSVAS